MSETADLPPMGKDDFYGRDVLTSAESLQQDFPMKISFPIAFLSVLVLSGCGPSRKAVPVETYSSPVEETVGGRPMYAPRNLIILYDPEVGKEPLKKAFADYGAEVIYEYGMMNGFAIRIPEKADILKAMEYFRKVKGVLSVERDRITYLDDPIRPRPIDK